MTGQAVEVLNTAEVTPSADYRPQLMMSPVEAKALADGLRENTRAILIDGDDYGVIPGTGSKPSLLKPGAEKLLQWFGLGHRMEQVDLERDENGKKFGVTYRCVVTKTMGVAEVVVATCDAYAGRDESKWKSAPWNTIIKMAEKRALVGAALQATGSSSLFTQDIEPHEAPDAPNPFMAAAIDAIKGEDADIVGQLKAWMGEHGVPTMPKDWTPGDLVSMLIAVGTFRAQSSPAHPGESGEPSGGPVPSAAGSPTTSPAASPAGGTTAPGAVRPGDGPAPAPSLEEVGR